MAAGAIGPFVPGKLNTQLTPIFHKRSFAAGALGSEIVFFGEVAGVGGVGPEATNMTRAFELEAPREITVGAMRIHFYDTTSADYLKIIKNYTVRLIVGGNALLDAPPEYWAAGMGQYGTGANNGMPDAKSIQGLAPHFIRIPSGVGFSVRFVGTSQTIAATAVIGVFLDGPFSKPVS